MTILTFLMLGMMISAGAREAFGQVRRAALGTAVGVAGGAVITMSAVVARAKFQAEFLESPNDLIHWQSAPMILTPAVGLMFGLAGWKPLQQSIVGSTSGMVVGAAVGGGIGWLLSADAESPWAGGIIGAGVGMTVGGLLLGTRAWLSERGSDDDELGQEPEATLLEVRIPL